MKLSVYTIALNEEHHVERFMAGCAGADLVVVGDTGSSDGTVEALRDNGAEVYSLSVRPWRFDVARNTVLSLLPDDVDLCLSVDLDEVLQPGWDDVLRANWSPAYHRVRYEYTWNFNDDGTPGHVFLTDKFHARKNYLWRHPCHETLYYVGDGDERSLTLPECRLHHLADSSKSRGQYLPLLKLSVDEDPGNDRMAHYYGRELMFHGNYAEAITELKRHLDLPAARWLPERAASMRYIGNCYKALCNVNEARRWYVAAVGECSEQREAWLDLAQICYEVQDWEGCYWAASAALRITEKTNTYITREEDWGAKPYDLAAIAAYRMGFREKAVEYGKEAVRLAPHDDRLKRNLQFYLE